MELSVYNIEGKETGRKAKLNKSVFGAEPNQHAIYLDVKQYLAANRQGTHKTKERGEIVGSTRKIKRQKGTGTARAGDIKNPMFRGGGRAFGPRPRNYDFKLNKKLKRLARISALSSKVKDKGLTVVEEFEFKSPKTGQYADFLNSFEASGKNSILVISEPNKNLYLSSRNLRGAKAIMFSELNTYDIINANKVFLSEKALAKIEETLKK